MIPNVLSIAVPDPSGGAGIFADLKAFSALGAYGMGVVVALTAQNTRGVTGIHVLPPEFVTLQIDTIYADIRVDAVKLGMLANAATVGTVAEALRRHGVRRLVVDPVMVAKSGHHLLEPMAVETLRREILPLAEIITPNLPEAAVLLQRPEARSLEEMRETARALHGLGCRHVLLKGGHLGGEESVDVLDDGVTQREFRTRRIETKNTHGTGCTLAAALTALLPRTGDIGQAVQAAKDYLTGAIAASGELDVGSGHGPTHHFHALWKR